MNGNRLSRNYIDLIAHHVPQEAPENTCLKASLLITAASTKTILLINGANGKPDSIKTTTHKPADPVSLVTEFAEVVQQNIGLYPLRWIRIQEEQAPSSRIWEVTYQGLVAHEVPVENGTWHRQRPSSAPYLRDQWEPMVSNHIQFAARTPGKKVIVIEPLAEPK